MTIVILVIGLPGSGKDLVSRYISPLVADNNLEVVRCCVGDKLRSLNATKPTGDLSDISVVNDILQNFFALKADIYILDGFPRSVEQLEYLKQISHYKIVTLVLQCSIATAVSRLEIRYVCKQCAKSLIEDFCYDCNIQGEQRLDDLDIKVIEKRVTIYQESIQNIITLLPENTRHINAEESIDEVKKQVEKVIKELI